MSQYGRVQSSTPVIPRFIENLDSGCLSDGVDAPFKPFLEEKHSRHLHMRVRCFGIPVQHLNISYNNKKI